MTQWTFLARPGHPVFLDALGHAFREAERIAALSQEAESKGEVYAPPSAVSALSSHPRRSLTFSLNGQAQASCTCTKLPVTHG